MQLIDHVSITVRYLAAAKPFNRAILEALGALWAASRPTPSAFHAAGILAGGSDEGAPGWRSNHSGYYAAFLLDPEGNEVEAVVRQAEASSR